MDEFKFVGNYGNPPKAFETKWVSPSNIAIVKYWGKFDGQIPANPSISFTLQNCHTTTKICFEHHGKTEKGVTFSLYFNNILNNDFRPKIQTYLERILPYCSFLEHYYLNIFSKNSFPHSSGIASSASSFSALSLGIIDFEKVLSPRLTKQELTQKASFLARLGSGSACRSIEGPIVLWGESDFFKGSSYYYGMNISEDTHCVFKDYQDTILIVHKTAKTVSSSVGHGLMNNHPFAQSRFQQAKNNIGALKTILKTGDLERFMSLTESEALSLHAMMMTSHPYYFLLKPETVSVIEAVWEYRKISKVPLCFTLDAGANIHLLYPIAYKEQVLDFMKNELVKYCENNLYICDLVGGGAIRYHDNSLDL